EVGAIPALPSPPRDGAPCGNPCRAPTHRRGVRSERHDRFGRISRVRAPETRRGRTQAALRACLTSHIQLPARTTTFFRLPEAKGALSSHQSACDVREAVESVVRRGALSRASFGDPLARLYLATFLLSLTIYSPILVLFYTGRGLSLFQILALEAFNSAVILMAEVPSGVLGDRIGLKKTMFLGYALQGVWIVILIFSHSYPLFLLGYAMLGMAIALRSGATEAWIYELLVERGQPQLMTRAQGALWSGGLAGRIASALLSVIVVRSATDGYFVLA